MTTRTLHLLAIALIAVSAAACGSTYGLAPCVTAGATYLSVYTETSGNCGPIADQTFTTPSDGVFKGPGPDNPSCATASGCTVVEDGCVSSLDSGYTITRTAHTVWTADGSSATEQYAVIVTAPDGGSSCFGTYDIATTRQ